MEGKLCVWKEAADSKPQDDNSDPGTPSPLKRARPDDVTADTTGGTGNAVPEGEEPTQSQAATAGCYDDNVSEVPNDGCTCPICNYVAKTPTALKIHSTRKHSRRGGGQTPEKKPKLAAADSDDRAGLELHIKRCHTKEKSYSCHPCTVTCANKSDYEEHLSSNMHTTTTRAKITETTAAIAKETSSPLAAAGALETVEVHGGKGLQSGDATKTTTPTAASSSQTQQAKPRHCSKVGMA